MSTDRTALITAERLAVAAPELAGAGPLPPGVAGSMRDLGFTAIELWTPWQVTDESAAALRGELAEAGLTVACVSSPSHLYGDRDGEGAQLLASSLRIAAVTGATCVNTYFGHGNHGDDRRAADAYAAAVAPLLNEAVRAGVTIVLENEFDAFGWDPSRGDITRRARSLHHLVTLVDHPHFRLNLDPANFLCAGEDVAEAVALLAPHAGYVHVKDVVRARCDEQPPTGWRRYTDGPHAYRTVELGTGEVPWPAVLRELAEVGYDGWFTLEPHCEPSLIAPQLTAARLRLAANAW